MTNADRIRQMTDEELAEMRTENLLDFIEKIQAALGKRCTFNYSAEQFRSSYLDWLKQEVEE